MKKIKSPLRYPGGKAKLTEYVANVIKHNDLTNCHFYEPFAGGSSVSLGLLQMGIVKSITLVEKDPLIYSFWKSVFDNTDKLCENIEKTEINIDTWKALNCYRNIDIPINTMISDLGFAGLFFNRTNYSGILKSGPIGGIDQEGNYKIDCRFNKNRLIETISFLSLYKDKVNVVWSDGISFLNEHKAKIHSTKSFVYVDPPYYNKGKSLYRCFFGNKEHVNLSIQLKSSKYAWLLSYDNAVYINDLYNSTHSRKALNRQKLFFDYSAGVSKKERSYSFLTLRFHQCYN